MARPLRIQFPYAWYHVMNRGRGGISIFHDNRDYTAFINILKESSELWKINVASFCLMPNHYHLLVQTPEANLSRAMRHINGVYTQHFNWRHNTDGPLFRGRYKSIIVDADSYLLALVRYIHRNPLRAGIVTSLEQYPWSSHHGYSSNSHEWGWIYRDFVLSLFSQKEAKSQESYAKFVAKTDGKELIDTLGQKQMPAILGDEAFIQRIKAGLPEREVNKEIPESRVLTPSRDDIRRTVCDYYSILVQNLNYSRRGHENEPRNVAIYLTRKLRGDRLNDIGDAYRMKTYSAVSSVVERIEERLRKDKMFRLKIEEIKAHIVKSQEQT